ncbi:MAG TPA: hypothetical protein PKV98_04475 [Burkholderiaceae bacterium]|nr:hypothetical protein [Burkholderiaceae bacterium]
MSAHTMIVNQIVDRVHVGRSNRDVIGYVASRMKDGRRTFLRLPRETRREIMQAAVARHAENRGTYTYVMGGLR